MEDASRRLDEAVEKMDGRRKIGVMLKGHESLLRLVGKRRKLHPSVFIFPSSEDLHLDVKVNVRKRILMLVSHGRTKRGLYQPTMVLMWGHFDT